MIPWVGFFDKRIYRGLGSSCFYEGYFELGKLSLLTVKVSSSMPAMSEFGILLNESEKGFVLTLRWSRAYKVATFNDYRF